MAGVDLEAGQVNDGFEQLQLRCNGLAEGQVAVSQRMLAAGFREPLDQHFIGGGEKQYITMDARVTHLLEQVREALQIARQVARIDADGDLRQAQIGVVGLPGQFRQQACREVVDTVEAVIFQKVQGGTLAGPGSSADYNQTHQCQSPLVPTMTRYRVSASGACRRASRKSSWPSFSASILSICKCCWVASSGTHRPNMRPTGSPSRDSHANPP